MNSASLIAFWLPVFLICYTYFLYPLCLLAAPYFVSNRYDAKKVVPFEYGQLPSVGIVISAYNEELHIRDRVKNLLELNYPKEKLKIYIGLDGCSDQTYSNISDISDERLCVLDFEENRGKASVLNDLVGRVTEEIIVFSDANTEFRSDNIRSLVKHFQEPSVGVICGELDLLEPSTGKNSDSLYWRIERFMKMQEGIIGGLLGANGANYAIRRNLYEPIPANTIVDDFYIVMKVADSGYRVVYEPEAKASEETAPDEYGEFMRRVRIGKGNYQAFFRLWKFLSPLKGRYFFTYMSHKVLRWFAPHLFIVALLANFALAKDSGLYLVLLLPHLMLYAVSWFVFKAKDRDKIPKLLRLPAYIMILNAAFLIAFYKTFSESSSGSWVRTDR